MKKTTAVIVASGFLAVVLASSTSFAAAAGKGKSKFYDFSDTLIDGEIKKPTALYTDARQQVKFERLLTLRKSFIKLLLRTSKERVFK